MSEKILDFPRYTRSTWMIGILLAIALLIMWFTGRGPNAAGACCAVNLGAVVAPAADDTQTQNVQAPAVPARSDVVEAPKEMNGPFSAKLVNGKVTLTGVVKDEAERTQIVDFAKQAFGADNVIDQLSIDASIAARNWVAQLGEVFAWQKAVPDAGLQVAENRLVLTGTVTSDAEKTARGEQAQAYFGPEVTIDNQIQVVAIASAGTKLTCSDRMAVAINFVSGSSALNNEAKAMLDQVFECVKEGRFEISGHTDNTGTAAGNQKLSKARAESTKAYLVGKGAKTADLTAVGYGPDKPIASNDSTAGKAQNRRIEFAKQ
jgi:OmpA-OmpF porin, OOP family